MNAWTCIILFFIVLFSYIHIQRQWKFEDEATIYEYDYTNLKNLQTTCEYKQPIIFPLNVPKMAISLNTMHIRDTREIPKNESTIQTISLTYDNAMNLIQTDTNSAFYTCQNNHSIIQHPQYNLWFKSLERILKPSFTVYTEYDLLCGSRKTKTVSQFHHESHTFLFLPKETNKTYIRLKMMSAKYSKVLNPTIDYINYEFNSKVNLFELDHMANHMIDILVKPGNCVFIPAYWYYSIEFQDKNNEVCVLKFTTVANALAHIKHHCLYYLQQSNVQEKWWKPIKNIDLDLIPIESENENQNEEINNESKIGKETTQKSETNLEEKVVDDLIEQLTLPNE
jgi:hypothetical protein